ncbi:MAG: CAP domain-containing protein [Pseudomonadota bacterium]
MFRLTFFRIAALAAFIVLGTNAAQASCSLPDGAQSFANQMAASMNAARQSNGLPPLQYDRRLGQAAMVHACDMQVNGFFDHKGSDGSNSHIRAERAGFRSCQTSENIAFGYPTAQIVVDGWMNSAGHRRNMLSTGVNTFGIGLAYAPGGPYAVLVLGRTC